MLLMVMFIWNLGDKRVIMGLKRVASAPIGKLPSQQMLLMVMFIWNLGDKKSNYGFKARRKCSYWLYLGS